MANSSAALKAVSDKEEPCNSKGSEPPPLNNHSNSSGQGQQYILDKQALLSQQQSRQKTLRSNQKPSPVVWQHSLPLTDFSLTQRP